MSINTDDCIICYGSSAHEVLRLINEHGGLSQPAVAKLMKVTLSSSNSHFQKLFGAGLIEPGESVAGTGSGRPSQMWRIREDVGCFMGLAVKGSRMWCSVCNFAGKVKFHDCRDFGRDDDRGELLLALDRLCEEAVRSVRGAGGQILQCFIGSTGYLLPDGGIEFDPITPALNGINLSEEVERRFRIPCYNDSLTNAQVQYELSKLDGDSTTMLLNWCEGISASFFAGREPIRWAVPAKRSRGIWNFGHIPIRKEGRKCQCGNRGCLEAYVGGKALAEHNPGLACANFPAFIARLEKGDDAAIRVLKDAAKLLGKSLYWPTQMFGVDTFLFTGTLGAVFDLYKDEFAAGLEENFEPADLETFRFRRSDFRDDQMGEAAAMAAKMFYLNPEPIIKARGLSRPNRKGR